MLSPTYPIFRTLTAGEDVDCFQRWGCSLQASVRGGGRRDADQGEMASTLG